jgi:diguanylate cyclase (GGDEF)-like protein
MEKTDTKVRTSMRNFLLALALLLITNILMGVTLMTMSKHTLRSQVEKRMLDVSKAAAAQIDGDVIKHLTAEDKDTEEYIRTLNILRSFQENIELDYIYWINPGPNDTFTFAIDPDREDPADFGEAIEATDALKAAAKGVPSVDKEPHADEWGRFYSAYSPIYDSDGNVVGIIGVDFDADWYDGVLNSRTAVAVIITMVALTIGIVLSFIIMSQNRKRFSTMLRRLSELELETKQLDQIIMQSSIKRLDMLPESKSKVLKTLANSETVALHSIDEYDAVNTSIESVYNKLHSYLRYVESGVYIDDTTGVKNKAAYRNKIKELDEQIEAGNAEFSAAFFDINGLKKTYTYFGFEAGEKLMFECAVMLKSVFGKENVYHITGDEYIVIMDKTPSWKMSDHFVQFEEALKQYNDKHIKENNLSVAKGSVTFDPEKHQNYRQVFIEVKDACDKDKNKYYGRNEAAF